MCYPDFLCLSISHRIKLIRCCSLIFLLFSFIRCEVENTELPSFATNVNLEKSSISEKFDKIVKDESTTEMVKQTTVQTVEISTNSGVNENDYVTTTTDSTTEPSSTTTEFVDKLDSDTTTLSYLEDTNTTLTTLDTTTTTTTTTTTITTITTSTATTTFPHTTIVPPIIPKFSIHNGSNICLLIEFNVLFEISYKLKNSTFRTTNISPNHLKLDNAGSECGDEVTVLRLGFQTKPEFNDTSNITMTFIKPKMNRSSFEISNEPSDYFLHNITIELKFDETDFPDAQQPYGNIKLNGTYDIFKTPVGSHYACVSSEYLDITDDSRLFNGSRINFEQITMQAFMETKNDTFLSNEIKCAQDLHPDNTVPIAVGVTLVVCIILALIVFVIFNRRNRRRYGSL